MRRGGTTRSTVPAMDGHKNIVDRRAHPGGASGAGPTSCPSGGRGPSRPDYRARELVRGAGLLETSAASEVKHLAPATLGSTGIGLRPSRHLGTGLGASCEGGVRRHSARLLRCDAAWDITDASTERAVRRARALTCACAPSERPALASSRSLCSRRRLEPRDRLGDLCCAQKYVALGRIVGAAAGDRARRRNIVWAG
jgi:hypothetical protein